MAALTKAQEHELIKSMIKLSPRALSIMMSNFGALPDKHCLDLAFGPRTFTFMPQGKRVIDILDLFDPQEQDFIPSVFSRPCDPAVPIVLQDFNMGTLTSLSPGYIKRSFKIGVCDEDLDKIMLRELPDMPYRTSDLTDDQKLSMHIFAAGRQVVSEIRETNVRSLNHSLLYGAFYNSGPGIDPADEFIDLCRNPDQQVCLSGDGWANKNASGGKTLEMLARSFKNASKQNCRATDYVFDEYGMNLFEQLVEYQECGKCWTFDPNIIRRQESFNRNTLPSEDPFVERGLKQLPYSNPRLPGVNFWYCDELEKTEICVEDEDGNEVGTGEYHMTPVMPQGSILMVDRTKINSTALRGNIHVLDVGGSIDQWTDIKRDPYNECEEFRLHTSPMNFASRVNASRMVYVDPVNCPPKCGCKEVECDPVGGKLVAESVNPLRAAGMNDQSEVIAEMIKRMKAQEEQFAAVKEQNENLANQLQSQAEDIAKMTTVQVQTSEAEKQTQNNQKQQNNNKDNK